MQYSSLPWPSVVASFFTDYLNLVVVVAFELSKCEEYGLWISSTHSTTRM